LKKGSIKEAQNMKQSALQIITLSPRDEEFSQSIKHAREDMEKRFRLITFLYSKMIGQWK